MLKRKRFKPSFSRWFLIFALLLLAGASFSRYQDFLWHLVRPASAQKEIDPFSRPQKITIPSLALAAVIKPGGIVDGQWLAEDRAVLFLPGTGRLAEGYNTVLYGYNRPGLFGDLKKLQSGDKIILEDSLGKSFTYEVYQLKKARPKEVAKLQSDIPNTLTLFTCDGGLEAPRLIVKARLISL